MPNRGSVGVVSRLRSRGPPVHVPGGRGVGLADEPEAACGRWTGRPAARRLTTPTEPIDGESA
jgi:hypothetical protein